MSWLVWVAIYLTGCAIIGTWAWRDIRKEPTAHGQAILAPVGCMMALFWPLLPALVVLCALFAAGAWLFGEDTGQ